MNIFINRPQNRLQSCHDPENVKPLPQFAKINVKECARKLHWHLWSLPAMRLNQPYGTCIKELTLTNYIIMICMTSHDLKKFLLDILMCIQIRNQYVIQWLRNNRIWMVNTQDTLLSLVGQEDVSGECHSGKCVHIWQ
jgi:hypothetical protein